MHLSQYCNPQQYEGTFWRIWEQFEVYNGNEDTYEDYLRVKRTVALRYAVVDPVLQEKVSHEAIGEADKEMAADKQAGTEENAPEIVAAQ